MKKVKQWILCGLGFCACIGATLYWRQRNKQCVASTMDQIVIPKTETMEESAVREWRIVLKENARIFNGLYSGLARVQNGSAKKPEKILREWCQRTHYKFEGQTVDVLCQAHIIPLIEAENREELTKWANLLLEAAATAGITKEKKSILILSEANAEAYVEWDSNDLYPEDTIEVITPAWYQNGKVLEQGQCKVVNTEET